MIGFDETHKAEDVRLKLQKLQSEYLLDLADVVVSVKDETGKVQLHHASNLITDTAVCQGFCGSLANLIFTECRGRRCFWRAYRCGNQRSLHERVDRHADS